MSHDAVVVVELELLELELLELLELELELELLELELLELVELSLLSLLPPPQAPKIDAVRRMTTTPRMRGMELRADCRVLGVL